jgi:rubredoxin
MAKYICSVCGFVYDEAKGIPDAGIAAGTRWEDLPEDWVCPLCGATKSEFEKQGESDMTPKKEPISVIESPVDMKEMSPLEVSALCTNLARGCEKQYKPEEATLFYELAGFYFAASDTLSVPLKLLRMGRHPHNRRSRCTYQHQLYCFLYRSPR